MANMVQLAAGTPLSPIYPQTIEEVFRLSKMALTAGMLKPQKIGYGDNATFEDAEAVLARGTMIIMQGMELGIPPMQALQLLAMINGRIVVHSEGVPGLLLAKGFKIKEAWSGQDMTDDWTCTVELTRPNGEKHAASFSVRDAKQARLWDQAPTKTSYGKTKPNDSAWYCYPKRMLKARALGFAGKDGGADALKGIQIQEEAEDVLRVANMRDITPKTTAPPDIPDDIPSEAEESQDPPEAVVSAAATATATIDRPDQVLLDLREALVLAKTAKDRAEVAENFEDRIESLPPAFQSAARKLLKDLE